MAKIKNDQNAVGEDIATTPAQAPQEGAIFAEVEKAMKEGVYRQKKKKAKPEDYIAKEKATVDIESKEVEAKKDKLKKTKPTKEKKVYEKSTWKHRMKVLGILCFLGVFTGSGLGVWYFNFALKSNVDYSSLKAEDYIGNVDDTFKKMSISNKDSWVETAKSKGYTPASSSLSAADNILLAEYNAKQASSYSIIGTGKVIAMNVPQTVYSAKKFDGNTYTFESISAGMLTVATCDVMDYNGSKVKVYQGKKPRKDGADWVYDSEMTTEEFEATVGVMPDGILPYIISEKTIESSTEVVYDDASGNYSFTIVLKPIESVLLYYKQVRRSGGLEADPEFKSIEIKFTLNENWDFVSTEIKESYRAVKFGLPVTCNGTLTTNYTFNDEVTLPV
ncbi:MAG: hypothetical protein J6K97_00600 [Clostridia bacterium]|nr:hypothetical protein [Clostridia bacterium]